LNEGKSKDSAFLHSQLLILFIQNTKHQEKIFIIFKPHK